MRFRCSFVNVPGHLSAPGAVWQGEGQRVSHSPGTLPKLQRKVLWNDIIVSGAGAEVSAAHQAVPTTSNGVWHGFRAVETPTPAHSCRRARPNHRRTVPAARAQRAQNDVLIKCGVGCARRHVVTETPEAPTSPRVSLC